MTNKIQLLILSVIIITCSSSFSAMKKKDDKNHIIVVNKGVGGNSTKDLLNRLQLDVLDENADLVILMVGTNDMLNSKKMLSYSQYTENLNKIVMDIKASGSQVLLMSSPPADSAYLFQRHDKNLYQDEPNVILDSLSHIVEQIAIDNEALFLNLFDAFNVMNLPRHNEDLFIRNSMNCNSKDGVHPTPLGYYFIAQNIYQFLKENKLLTSFSRIFCFGDSITSGAGAIGGGTVNGQNYPSFLYKMINSKD